MEVGKELQASPRCGNVPREQKLLAWEYHKDARAPMLANEPDAARHQPSELQPAPPPAPPQCLGPTERRIRYARPLLAPCHRRPVKRPLAGDDHLVTAELLRQIRNDDPRPPGRRRYGPRQQQNPLTHGWTPADCTTPRPFPREYRPAIW